ncbi:MAG: hypothetical protein VCG02_16525 [Verrucomicrobiota bacterium]
MRNFATKIRWIGVLWLVPCLGAEQPWPRLDPVEGGPALPGTALLAGENDWASELVDGAHRFLDRHIAGAVQQREAAWPSRPLAPDRWAEQMAPRREALARMIGLADARIASPRLVYTTPTPGRLALAETPGCTIYTVRWPVFERVNGVGLLFVPRGPPLRDVIAVPDADAFPGWERGCALAASGCRVLVPMLINRGDSPHRMSWRDWLYRPAYELGRHLIGYEVAKILSAADCLAADASRPLGLIGYGEGGMLALYAAAVDPRFAQVGVAGYFQARERTWEEPAYRTVFARLDRFGDAELAAMVAPARLLLGFEGYPVLRVPPGTRAKPGHLAKPTREAFDREYARIADLNGGQPPPLVSRDLLPDFLRAWKLEAAPGAAAAPVFFRAEDDYTALHRSQVDEIDRHNQWLLGESAREREGYWKKLDTTTLERFTETVEPYREAFATELIGRFERERLPANPRSRKILDGEKVEVYEVVLDVFPDLVAYGLLIRPRGLKPGEKRPVVVCQHGLEGRPQDLIGERGFSAYQAFASRLAERGYVTFAPQNLYLFKDRFRLLQFKANSMGKTLFSLMVPQHRQICDWLATLDFVDAERMAFYGLSYGGKSAMRIPPLVPAYKAVICSADFNEWVWKNASSRSRYSYAQLGEYEIFEWNLGMTFNYSDMAALIAPRPFMVERGHFDGVAPDEKVAAEFARVRRLYEARLGLAGRAEIEWFAGPHTINGQGTFAFLDRVLAGDGDREHAP